MTFRVCEQKPSYTKVLWTLPKRFLRSKSKFIFQDYFVLKSFSFVRYTTIFRSVGKHCKMGLNRLVLKRVSSLSADCRTIVWSCCTRTQCMVCDVLHVIHPRVFIDSTLSKCELSNPILRAHKRLKKVVCFSKTPGPGIYFDLIF